MTARSWTAACRLGAVVAFAVVAGTVLDIVLTMLPGWGPGSVPSTAPLWFAQLSGDPLLGLRNLDLLNATLAVVGLPLYVALLGAHRRVQPALALLALLLVGVGTALFVANNAALPMLELARRYGTAGAERPALEAAAEGLLARGAHGSLGAFPGFFVSSVGTLLVTVAMVHGRVFGRTTAWIGVAGAALMSAYTVGIALVPGSAALINGVAMPGGLLMIAWYVLVARRLFRLANEPDVEA